jgi:hypothetical protein
VHLAVGYRDRPDPDRPSVVDLPVGQHNEEILVPVHPVLDEGDVEVAFGGFDILVGRLVQGAARGFKEHIDVIPAWDPHVDELELAV